MGVITKMMKDLMKDFVIYTAYMIHAGFHYIVMKCLT